MTNQAHNILATAIESLKQIDLSKLDSAQLVPLIKQVQDICSFNAAIHAQIETRALGNGELIPGVMIKDVVTHRKWSDPEAAAELAREQIGEKAFTVPALISPAQMEKLGEMGKAFVSLASFKPEAGKKVAY